MVEGRDRDFGRPQPAETVAAAPGDDVDPSPRRRGRRGPIAVALVALLAVVGVAGAIALTRPDDDGHRAPNENLKTPAAQKVLAALGTTTAAGSFTATYEIHSTPATTPSTEQSCPPPPPAVPAGSAGAARGCIVIVDGGGSPVTITGVATIDKDPYRMRSVSDVTGFGQIITRVDDTRLWETGGGNYGMSPRGDDGPGAPISGFAGLVEGTLGRGPGALTMLTIASPNGYLNLSKEAVSGVSPAGTGTVDGVPVTYFDIDVRPQQLLDVPGLTGEQTKTIREALAVLEDVGYRETKTRVGIDAAGLIRETSSVATFADGSRQTSRTTFSEFGCAGIVELPGDPPSTEAAAPCADAASTDTSTTPAPTVHVGASPTTTVSPGPSTTTIPASGSSTTASSTTTTTGPGQER
jgi:hypothetical protein